MIIAMDGTSGSGKSTLAKKLAQKLNFGFFSAGALYRALTVKTLMLGIGENDEDALMNLVNTTEVIYTYDGIDNLMIVDGVNFTDKLYSEEVSNFVSKIAGKPYIRDFVKRLQQDTKLHNENIVMEGRDIGSVIFPDADFKIYVDCKAEIRAKRRMIEYESHGEHVNFEKVVADLEDRDYRDIHRPISPLVMCENAFLIDTSHASIEECLSLIFKEMIRRRLVTEKYLADKNIRY